MGGCPAAEMLLAVNLMGNEECRRSVAGEGRLPVSPEKHNQVFTHTPDATQRGKIAVKRYVHLSSVHLSIIPIIRNALDASLINRIACSNNWDTGNLRESGALRS